MVLDSFPCIQMERWQKFHSQESHFPSPHPQSCFKKFKKFTVSCVFRPWDPGCRVLWGPPGYLAWLLLFHQELSHCSCPTPQSSPPWTQDSDGPSPAFSQRTHAGRAAVCGSGKEAGMGGQSGPSWSTWGWHLGTPVMMTGIEMTPLVPHLWCEGCGGVPPVRPGKSCTLHSAPSSAAVSKIQTTAKVQRMEKLWAVSV